MPKQSDNQIQTSKDPTTGAPSSDQPITPQVVVSAKLPDNSQVPVEQEPDIEGCSDDVEEEYHRAELLEGGDVPTSRIGRLMRTGWAARHAVPLALKRTVELLSSQKEDRKQVTEKILQEQEAVAEELFRTLGNLKGVVQKFGQLASYLEGVLPSEFAPIYQKVLSRLQDSAPSLPPMATQEVVEDELDCLIEDRFAEFELRPFAAASVGQVHRARLHNGLRVAVKVQYPDIDRAFVSDLKNMKMMEMLFAPIIHYYKGREILDTIHQNLLAELDYLREAELQNLFHRAFDGHPLIHIPRVITELCTGKVLVTEFVDGRNFTQLQASDEHTRCQAAEALFRYYAESLFIHHIVNSDPHPGNYVFHANGRVSFLDFGAAIELEPEFMRILARFLLAHIENDNDNFCTGLTSVFGIPDQDPVLFAAYQPVFRCTLAPLDSSKQPFTFSSGWMDSCFEEGMSCSKDILLRGGRIPKLPPRPKHLHPNIAVVYRMAIGLASVLLRLQATNDWPAIVKPILEQSISQK
jgi:hypothetical protein